MTTILPARPDAGAAPSLLRRRVPARAPQGGPAAHQPETWPPRWRSVPAVRDPRRRHTARAFVLAPMVPAALAALLASAAAGYQNTSGFLLLFLFIPFCVVGHLSALFIGVPLYLLIPRDKRDLSAAVMLLGGMVAALPWTIGGVLSRSGDVLLVAGGAFGLGCIGGIAFALIRRPSSGPSEAAGPDLPKA